MVKTIVSSIVFQVCSLVILSCAGGGHFDGTGEMHFLISDYHQERVSLLKMSGKKTVEEKPVLDLTELHGNRIIRAGFLTPNTVYVAFEGIKEKLTEIIVQVRIYDTVSFNKKDVFTYKSTYDNIRIIDVENSGAYFTGYLRRKTLMYSDFQNSVNSTMFEFPDGEEITAINCRYNDQFVIVNTYEETKDVFRYYFIDKFSYKKVNEGIGQIYGNRYSDLLIYENDSRIYILDNLVNPIKKIEKPVEKNKIFSQAIPVDKYSFIVCFYSTIPDYISSFLFGGEQVIKHYSYRFVRILDFDRFEFEYGKIYMNRNHFGRMVLFDACNVN
jgi:hypothetical protein